MHRSKTMKMMMTMKTGPVQRPVWQRTARAGLRGMFIGSLAGTMLAVAGGVEVTGSGFGTVGYAQTNRPYTYQRYLRDEGSVERDTLLGAQLDAQFSPQWSATVQLKLAPSLRQDAGWSVTPSWAFAAWRPADDWLLRAGRMRVPLYMHSEALDVGVAHDMARLPTDVYSIVPSNDFDGLSVGRTWPRGETGELALDVYSGRAKTTARFWLRDGLPPYLPAGAYYKDVTVQATGLALTLRDTDLVLRMSLHATRTQPRDGSTIPQTLPYVSLGGGDGYFVLDGSAPERSAIRNTVLTLGSEAGFGGGWKIAAEAVRNWQHDTVLGSDHRSGYIALFRQLGDFTPYVSASMQKSGRHQLDLYDLLVNHPLPSMMPGADQVNAAQRVLAESNYVADQRSWALGSSWRLSAGSKLKFEWMRTHVGRVSRMIDVPAGQATPSNTSVDVFSLNYNFAF